MPKWVKKRTVEIYEFEIHDKCFQLTEAEAKLLYTQLAKALELPPRNLDEAMVKGYPWKIKTFVDPPGK